MTAGQGPERYRRRAIPPALMGVAVLAAVLAWEIARPTLPVSFELAAAARLPGAPSWHGRLPMALLALGGIAAIYTYMSGASERRAGMYAVAILATVPAWFVHGRTMTGAIVPMAASAMVLAGWGVALLHREARTRVRVGGAGVAVIAATASALAARWGVPQRGLVVVAAVPSLAVASAALLWRGETPLDQGRRRAAFALLAVAGSLVIAGIAIGMLRPAGAIAAALLGAREPSGVGSTPGFEAPVTALAYGLVPWTPLVPLALARRPRNAAHLAILIAAASGIAAHAALASRSGSNVIVGVAAIAAAVALMLRSLENVQRPAVALVITVGAVGWLVAHDVRLAPERVLLAFGATDAAMPAAHAAASSLAIRSSVWLCMVLTGVALLTPRAWLPVGRGLAIVAAGVLGGLVLRTHAYPELLARLSPGAAFDAWASRHRPGEPLGVVGIDRRAVAFAPGTAVVVQKDLPTAGRWLATEAEAHANAHANADADAARGRRFLAVEPGGLAAVNAEYRKVHGRNVPVLAGHGGGTLLAASALVAGERSDNPLEGIVLAGPPPRLRKVGASLEGGIEVLGWELVDEGGKPLEAVPRRSRSARVRMVLRAGPGVGAPGVREIRGYCTFLHVDHVPARFAVEHRELTYPMDQWRGGDVVVDELEVRLGAHFRAGSYRMYWGVGVLPCEDDRRMRVLSGPTDGHHRIDVGVLEVR